MSIDYNKLSKLELISYLRGQEDRVINNLLDVGELLCEVLNCEVCPVTRFQYDKRPKNHNGFHSTPCCEELSKWLRDIGSSDQELLYRIDYDGSKFKATSVEASNKWYGSTISVTPKEVAFINTMEEYEAEIENRKRLIVDDFQPETTYESNNFKMVSCRRCRKYFALPYIEYNWFVTRGMSVPKKCKLCRAKNKVDNV